MDENIQSEVPDKEKTVSVHDPSGAVIGDPKTPPPPPPAPTKDTNPNPAPPTKKANQK